MEYLIPNIKELLSFAGLKGFLAAAGAFALHMVGHPDSAALWLAGLMGADLVLGVCRAWSSGEGIKGAKIVRGAWKFFRYFIAVAIFAMTNKAVQLAIPYSSGVIVNGFIAYLAINEAFSCVDHLAFFGMPVPEPFLRRLRGYRDACVNGEWDGKDRRKDGQEQQEEGEE